MVIKRYQVILAVLPLIPITATFAADECIDQTCVDVFTEDNQLIITAQKGGSATTAATKKPIAKPKPLVSRKSTPKPTPKVVVPKKIVKVKPKPKVIVTQKASTASLSDRLIKLLPVGDINFQPENDALVNMPVYFWTKTPQRFTALVPILDLIVYVNLHSTFSWSYGDGAVKTTTNQGGPYPIGFNTHTYLKNGSFPVTLRVIWQGTWMVNGITTAISGDGITQSITHQISIVNAVGRFTK